MVKSFGCLILTQGIIIIVIIVKIGSLYIGFVSSPFKFIRLI